MTDLNIRPATAQDLPDFKAIINATEMFPSELLDDMIAGYLAGTDQSIWLAIEHTEPILVAFCAPEEMTEGT